MQVYTIGFTHKSARQFFETLGEHGVRRLVDVRVSNRSQLAGFTKRDDLAYFLTELLGVEYAHEPELAPTTEMMRDYRRGVFGWPELEKRFLALLAERRVEERLSPSLITPDTVLLCSEPTADRCHRRLVLEYLDGKWGGIEPVHL